MERDLPVLKEDQGRIYFYRPSSMGAAVQPEVTVNGQVVGKSQPRSFFFIDRTAGNYRASTQTEVEATVDIALKPRQKAYVQMSIGMGLFVGRPEFQRMSEAEGAQELASLAYGGPALQPLAMTDSTPPSAMQGPAVAVTPASSAPMPAPMPPLTAPPEAAPAPSRPAPAAASRQAPATPFAKTSLEDLKALLPSSR